MLHANLPVPCYTSPSEMSANPVVQPAQPVQGIPINVVLVLLDFYLQKLLKPALKFVKQDYLNQQACVWIVKVLVQLAKLNIMNAILVLKDIICIKIIALMRVRMVFMEKMAPKYAKNVFRLVLLVLIQVLAYLVILKFLIFIKLNAIQLALKKHL